MPKFFGDTNPADQKIHPKVSPLKNTSPSLNHLSIKKVSLIFRALNHKLRQEILKYIEKNTKSSVTDIYIELRLDQSVTSQHLAILRRAGLLKTTREGKFMYYQLNAPRLEMINNMIVDLLK